MKKVIVTFTLGTICVLVIPYLISYALNYPPLPIESMTKREVLEKGNDADKQLVKLTSEKNSEWYITSERDISAVDDMIKELVGHEGWVFKEKEGSGLIFEKRDEKLVATTEMWTGDYVICQIPANFRD